MRTRTHKLLQILLALALAVAPLRASLAAADSTPTAATGDNATHCEHMQPGPTADSDSHGMHAGHDSALTDSAPCNHDCGGSCCGASCSTCVHATLAIPANLTLLPGSTAGTPSTSFSPLFPERPAIPLLHPPAASRS